MKVATKLGDTGMTDLLNQRVSKADIRIQCLAQLDHCMAAIILYIAQTPQESERMKPQVERLSLISAIVSGYVEETQWDQAVNHQLDEDVAQMEKQWDQFNFVYPFNHFNAAQLNQLRTEVRLVESKLVELNQIHPISSSILSYINRLSDWFYLNCCNAMEM